MSDGRAAGDTSVHLLPGAVGVSRLCVYDTVAPDGAIGGTPHIHLCCSEAYVVVSGTGLVQTLGGDGYRETPLVPGTVAWFSPGTVHRLVNQGGLELVVLMQNSALPEAGDAVLTFPVEVLADPVRYAKAATLPDGGAPDSDVTAAYRRRDLAVTGFRALRAAVERDGVDALRPFHEQAVRLVAPHVREWRERWATGALRAAEETGRQLDAIAAGDPAYLRHGGVRVLPSPSERGRRGMCGLLDTYHLQ
jgi:mannose-6-phosphate isomerase-like protein (cupin superfamily)